MKYNIYHKVLGLTLAALTFTACTDQWDDHYEGTAAGQDGETSIWQAITSNSELSNFQRVMELTGYDKALAGSQVFSVFAPVNSNFTEDDVQAIEDLYLAQKAKNVRDKDNRAIKEFVQNHIALYNYSTRGKADTIAMMNGKYLVLTDDGLANSSFVTKDELKSNGILFTMQQPVEFFHNVFEYLSADEDLDSVGTFMSKYNEYELDETSSVPGGIIDGKTWYLDSVKVLNNDLFYELGYINREDSTYWMVAPTNDVWNQYVTEYEPYFAYDDKVEKRDSMAYVQPRLALLRGTVFSRTRNTDESIQDSALSVNATLYAYRTYKDQRYYMYDRPFDEGGVFNGTEVVPCSNGQVMKSSNWNIDKTQTFLQTIIVEGENRIYRDGVDEKTTADPVEVEVATSNAFYNQVSRHKYLLVHPTAQSAAEVRFKIPEVLSNVGYDIYVVFVPTGALETLGAQDYDVPVKFRAEYCYHEADGTQSKYAYLYNEANSRDFESVAGQVDTVCLGKDIKFPTCSWGLRDPQVLLKLKTSLRNADRQNHTYTDRLRIDCIILKPHEETTATEQ